MNPNTPILVGVGQMMVAWDGSDPANAPSPASLMHGSVARALGDTGASHAVIADIDRIITVRTMLDSVPGAPQPFGRCANPPATLAAALGIEGASHIYSVVGGDQPQSLVNECAAEIFAGNVRTVLIAGAEATAAMKTALKRQILLDWSASSEGAQDDRGLGPVLLSPYEISNGLGAPTQTYPAFEHALRTRLGLSRDDHVQVMSELWAGFSDVAATNPYAQFRTARTAGYLATATAENYPVADPYLKWHVAQDAVNQGAAVVMTSVGRATALGIDPAKWIFLHGYSKATDRLVGERPDLSRSIAMELALARALAVAGITPDEVGYHDLYSCFPCAVLLAAEALGLDWRAKAATVTGGLPFFGGAGNNYSMHAIAAMVEKLRADRAGYGLVLANGGFLSKEAVGIYSARPVEDWQPVSSADIQQQIDQVPAPTLISGNCSAIVETYTVTFTKGVASRGYVIANNATGRVIARVRSGDLDTLAMLQRDDMVGKSVTISHDGGINYFTLADQQSSR